MNAGDEPVFVAKYLNYVPPLSMNTFDMSHIIEEMQFCSGSSWQWYGL